MAYPIPEPVPQFVTALITNDGTFAQRVWPEETAHLFPQGSQRPLVVAAKLRPLIVLSRRSEMQITKAALVVPCSRWLAEEWGAQAPHVEANRVPYLHWLAGSRAFRMINACTVDFRWTYRLPLAQLERARPDEPRDGFPRGPVAKLTDAALAELLGRFRAYLT